MTENELLKTARDGLLGLHKSLVDFERGVYEADHGVMTAAQFLSVLLEDTEFSWLRRFSTLIVDIDEMFAQKDGYDTDQVAVHLAAVRKLIGMEEEDEGFKARYRAALARDPDAAAKHGELKVLLFRSSSTKE